MSGKSGFMAKQQVQMDVYMTIAERVTRQLMVDSLQIALHEKGWGYDRLKELTLKWAEIYDYFYDTMDLKNVECDVKRHHLDELIRDIVKDKQEFIPFEERYPDIKKINYSGKRGKHG